MGDAISEELNVVRPGLAADRHRTQYRGFCMLRGLALLQAAADVSAAACLGYVTCRRQLCSEPAVAA